MPFDALVRVPVTVTDDDALARLGIVPVPEALVAEYKKAVIENYSRRDRESEYRVKTGRARWETIALNNVQRDLAKPLVRAYTQDRSAAPPELAALAKHVQHHVKDATFALSYFDTDPVLYVIYPGKVACLGIWDRGKIVHIAEWQRPGWRAWVQSALRRLR